MAFVNKQLSEVQKLTFDIDVFRDPMLSLTTRLNFSRWVVDHERDAFMVCIGGGGPEGGGNAPHATYYLIFSFQGVPINFKAQYRSEGNFRNEEEVVLYISVFEIEIPNSLVTRQKEILQGIEEALDTAGNNGFVRKCYSKVKVQFTPFLIGL